MIPVQMSRQREVDQVGSTPARWRDSTVLRTSAGGVTVRLRSGDTVRSTLLRTRAATAGSSRIRARGWSTTNVRSPTRYSRPRAASSASMGRHVAGVLRQRPQPDEALVSVAGRRPRGSTLRLWPGGAGSRPPPSRQRPRRTAGGACPRPRLWIMVATCLRRSRKTLRPPVALSVKPTRGHMSRR